MPYPLEQGKRGFTLIELLIVIAIIAMLAALIVPRLSNVFKQSQVETTRAQIGLLVTALENFRVSNGRYPSQEEGLRALIEAPPHLPTWSGPYLHKKAVPLDAWGKEFQYAFPPERGGIDYDLYSFGADGQEGGEGNAADLGNW